MARPWIGVDLDGTLAHYDGWKGVHHIGAPIPAMVERVKEWVAKGFKVKIFTARVSKKFNDAPAAKMAIQTWCLEHSIPVTEVTNEKDFQMIELWDDRAVRVGFNTGAPCCTKETFSG